MPTEAEHNSKSSAQLEAPYLFDNQALRVLSDEIRKGVFEICINANSGHIGGSSSSVELLTVLYFGGILRYDPNNLRNEDRDRVLLRGHLGPLRYKIFSLIGEVADSELITYRQYGSRLQGHEEYQRLPGIDITPSGSLGMVLSYGLGASIAAKEQGKNFRTFVFLGDGEEQEGNVSEAARHAAHLSLDNLIVVLDKNKKQLSNPVDITDSSDVNGIWRAYGWKVVEIKDGHNIEEIRLVYKKALEEKGPLFIIANTIKGYGLPGAEKHFSGYHTVSTCPEGIPQLALANLQERYTQSAVKSIRRDLACNRDIVTLDSAIAEFTPLDILIEPSDKTSKNLDYSQIEYFRRLRDYFLQNKLPLFFLTADVTKDDDVDLLQIKEYAKYFNVGIREQHMIAMSHGLSLTYPAARVIINSNDAFTYRGMDQLNALSQGKGNVVIIGDVAGITNAKNGKTHQTTGQPGAILGMPGVAFLEPGDVRDLFNCLNWAIGKSRGPVFIRSHSASVEPFMRCEEDKDNIDFYIPFRASGNPELTIVASGYTVRPSIDAAEYLNRSVMPTQVVNVVNHKSLNRNFASLFPSNKPVLTVYNGIANVLQSNVAGVLLEYGLNLPSRVVGHGFEYGTSGSLIDLAKNFRLDSEGIVSVVKEKINNV